MTRRHRAQTLIFVLHYRLKFYWQLRSITDPDERQPGMLEIGERRPFTSVSGFLFMDASHLTKRPHGPP